MSRASHRHWLLVCSCLMLGLAACTPSTPSAPDCIVINHPKPELAVDNPCSSAATCSKTADQIRAQYVPIESEDEALSYALVMTEYRAAYDLEKTFCESIYVTYVPLVPQIEETHVERLGNGYRVYLFNSTSFYLESVAIDIAPDGTLTLSSRRQIARII